MTRVLYLSHDLDDAATWRRVDMLEAGGALVEVAGFRRLTTPLERKATVLGQTHNAKFLRRAFSALRLLTMDLTVPGDEAPDVILARNLEMLPLARQRRRRAARKAPPRLIYEVLDIHRLLVGPGIVSSLLRLVERRLCRGVDGVVVSSMRFDTEYFRRYGQLKSPALLVENKIWHPKAADPAPPLARALRPDGGPLVIGWFGILRCARSLHSLDALCRRADGQVRLVLRGRPELATLPDFHQIVSENPHIEFHGPYRYPDDLPENYADIDIAWLVDRFDAGANSDWLLPNRLYESCGHGVVPLALAGTEAGAYLARSGLGLVLADLRPDVVDALVAGLDETILAALRERIAALGTAHWRTTRHECVLLVQELAGRTAASSEAAGLAANDAEVAA